MSLINELIKGLLPEQEKKKVVAVYGGGFKPPTKGHFAVVKKAIEDNPDIDEFIINIGGKERDGVTPEERSEAAKAMASAVKDFKVDVANTIEAKQSFILDGTAASVNQTEKLKQELEEAGYEVFMLYVYTDLERSLKQNQDRFEKSDGKDRSLAPAIVMRTWLDVTKNWTTYKNIFGNNFVSVANTLKDEKLKDVEDVIKKYLIPFKPTGTKPKTASQQARSDKRKAQVNADVQALLNDDGAKDIIDGSVSKEEAQSLSLIHI